MIQKDHFGASRGPNAGRIGRFKDLIASGVRVGDLLTLSGQVSVNNDGDVVGSGDIGLQLRQAYSNVRDVLGQFSASMDSIVDEMWFVTDIKNVMENIEPLLAIREEVFGGPPEVTQTLAQVSGLVMPELLIEVKCIARL